MCATRRVHSFAATCRPVRICFKPKRLTARLYEFFEGGNVGKVVTSSDERVRRCDTFSISTLWKPGMLQLVRQVVWHTQKYSTRSQCDLLL